MKKLFKTFSMLLAAAAMVTATSCNDDLGKEIGNNSGLEDNQNTPSVYVGVNFTMPAGVASRSHTDNDNTSNDGFEVGTDQENNVNEVLLVLANSEDYSYIASATVPKKDIYKHTETIGEDAGTNNYHAKAKFTKTQLSQYYLKKGASGESDSDYEARDGKILVFVIVNPSGRIVETLSKANFGDIDWIQTQGDVIATGVQTEGSIWAANNFLMSNSKLDERYIPGEFKQWNAYSTSSHYFNLSADNETSTEYPKLDNSKGGPIDVIRAAARMDFKDGSPTTTAPNTYEVIFEDDANGQPDKGKPIIDVMLNKMCLVNMSNSFYYLKRVSNNGLDTGAPKEGDKTFDPAASKATYGWELCGPEKTWMGQTGNYVVSSYAQMKSDFMSNFTPNDEDPSQKPNGQPLYAFGYSNYFNYPFFGDDGILDDNTTLGSTENDGGRWYVSQISDVLAGSQKDEWKDKEYHVWRYLTENTIPSPSTKQVNGISTGVVFKGKMQINKKAEKKTLPEDQNSLDYVQKKAFNDLIDAINKTGEPDATEDPILYEIAGDIYAGWKNAELTAIYTSMTFSLSPDRTEVIVDWNRENTLYQAVFGNGGTGHSFTVDGVTYKDELDIDKTSADYYWKKWDESGRKADSPEMIAFKKVATNPEKSNITIYQRSKDNVDDSGYYCYYYYWNRHNDNGNNGVMGPMEFAVVRNNVYKLAVTEISKLGHPRIPLNDPDSPTPDTPDEKENVYITVDAKVLPWVVRVNNIKF